MPSEEHYQLLEESNYSSLNKHEKKLMKKLNMFIDDYEQKNCAIIGAEVIVRNQKFVWNGEILRRFDASEQAMRQDYRSRYEVAMNNLLGGKMFELANQKKLMEDLNILIRDYEEKNRTLISVQIIINGQGFMWDGEILSNMAR